MLNKEIKNYFINSGVGQSQYKLVAFDNALIDAGVSNYNLLKVSSILPASCVRVSSVSMAGGATLLTAYASATSNITGEKIATAVAVGIPGSPAEIGVIMESEGVEATETEKIARDMVFEAMKNHGIEIDHIESSSVEGVVEEGFLSLISVIAMW